MITERRPQADRPDRGEDDSASTSVGVSAREAESAATRLRDASVIGAGSWGTALAIHMANLGARVRLWSRSTAHVQAMKGKRENERYLAGVSFPPGLEAISSMEASVESAELIVVAVPSHGLRPILAQLAQTEPSASSVDILLAVKGIEETSLQSMHEVAHSELAGWLGATPTAASTPAHAATTLSDGSPTGSARLGRGLAVLGGPSFAAEVARKLPTTVVVASEDPVRAVRLQRWLSSPEFRVYSSEDVVGVELGGALKNVIALAVGLCDGAGLGNNARAGLITRGLAELTRLAIARGAKPETLAGLAGLGDLVLTCTGELSRNRRVGLALGAGQKLDEVLAGMGMVAEGVVNTRTAMELGRLAGVELPIISVMYEIIYGGLPVSAAVELLMRRELSREFESS